MTRHVRISAAAGPGALSHTGRVALRSDETFQRLQQWTSGQTPSERLAAQILLADGYRDIDPIHPLGGPDGRRDAEAIKDGKPWLMAVYFPNGQQPFSVIRKKVLHDAAGVTSWNAYGLAFVTNQYLTDGERTELRTAAGCPLDLFHVERLVLALDSPPMRSLRRQYLSIDYATDALTREGPTDAYLLDQARKEAWVRRQQRLRAAGAPQELLPRVIEWMNAHTSGSALAPIPSGTLTVLAAPAGSGKTEAAHDWFCANVDAALASAARPFPLWLEARDVPGTDVAAAVRGHLGLPTIHAIGCDLVIDGLDQVDPTTARRLLESAERFCTWDRVTVLATARPEPALSMFALTPVAGWHHERGRGLAELVAGEHLPHALMSSEIAESLERPLLAIALGLRVSAGDLTSLTPAALIRELSQQVLRSSHVDISRELTTALAAMAAHIISTGQPYPAGDLELAVRREVRKTPVVADNDCQLTFSLPIHEQTYGALAITSGLVDLATVASAANFPIWRYALALSINLDDPHNADEMLGSVTDCNPAAGSWLIDELDTSQRAPRQSVVAQTGDAHTERAVRMRHQLVLDPAEGPMDAAVLKVAAPLRDAYRTFADALGPLATLLSRRSEGAAVAAGWDVNLRTNDVIVIGWRTSDDTIDLGPLPPEVDPSNPAVHWDYRRWPLIQSLGAAAGYGRWKWSRNLIRSQLQPRLKRLALPCSPDGILGLERRWHLAQLIHHGGERITHQPIPIADLRTKIENQLEQTANSVRATWQIGGSSYDRDDLTWLHAQLPDDEFLIRPAPAPDRPHDLGRWASSMYSRDQLRALVTHTLTGALDGYTELVERNFASFGPALGIAGLAPARIVGDIDFWDSANGEERADPTLTYVLLSDDQPGIRPRVEIGLRRDGDGPGFPSPPDGRNGAGHGRFSYGYAAMTELNVYGARPSTPWAYNWLISDLAAVGWVQHPWTVM